MDLGPGRRSHRLVAAAALLAFAIAALFLAAAAGAEVRSGSASDGIEPERLPPGQDIVAVQASYDTATGTITAAVTTLGAPEALATRALRTDFFPVDASGECVAPEARIVSIYSEAGAFWVYNGSALQAGQKSVAGNVATLSATSPLLVNQPFFCVDAYVLTESGEVLEALASPFKLIAPATPPLPPPPSSPPPSNPLVTPTPPPAPKLAKLSLGGLSRALTLHRGKWKQVKLAVTNDGTATAAEVTLKLGKAKGVAIKPKSGQLKLKSIAPGKSKTATFELLLTKKAKASSTISLTLTGAKGVKSTGAVTVNAWQKHHKGGKAKETPVVSPLAERLFYAYENHPSESATLIGYAFLDGTWAYHGIPAGGLPTCTEVTGAADKEGCVKYSYDPKTGAVQIGSLGGGKILADGSLEIDGEKYSPASIPAAGTRYQVEQEYGGYTGLCGLITGCTTFHEHLLLTSGGEFVLTRSSLTTIGGSGPGETFIAAGSYPPDQHGTYAIEPRGRIRLNYADGTVKTRTIAIILNKEGKPDPVNDGLLLDSDYFNFLPDD